MKVCSLTTGIPSARASSALPDRESGSAATTTVVWRLTDDCCRSILGDPASNVAVENRAVTDVRGGLLDAAVGFGLRVAAPLIVVRHVPPWRRHTRVPEGKPGHSQHALRGLDLPVVKVDELGQRCRNDQPSLRTVGN
jgi:hypothetical protein